MAVVVYQNDIDGRLIEVCVLSRYHCSGMAGWLHLTLSHPRDLDQGSKSSAKKRFQLHFFTATYGLLWHLNVLNGIT